MADLTHPDLTDLSIDQDLALRTAATRLASEFAAIYGPEIIERFLHTSYEHFATSHTIPNYLPLLAERFARQRLQALARVEGHNRDGEPVVLLLCTHNAGRSQMALGFFNLPRRRPGSRLVWRFRTRHHHQPRPERRHRRRLPTAHA